MFNDMDGLEELDLSSFNTSKVTDMSYMFSWLNNSATIVVSSSNKDWIQAKLKEAGRNSTIELKQ